MFVYVFPSCFLQLHGRRPCLQSPLQPGYLEDLNIIRKNSAIKHINATTNPMAIINSGIYVPHSFLNKGTWSLSL